MVDEAHVYRGVFGSHVANVLRRLRRIAAAYGTEPRFLLASATIANPGELAERLTGLDDVTVIDRDGSPGAKKTIAMWNPPITDEQLATRRSALAEAADLLAELVSQGARTIVFMKSRKAVELMAKFAQLALEDLGRPELADRIAPVPRRLHAAAAARARAPARRGRAARRRLDRRAGARDRHRLARRRDLRRRSPARSRRCARCGGAPGGAGAGSPSYVAGEDALDQFFCRHPTSSSTGPVEAAILDPENEQIHAAHVLCAAHEGPLEPADAEWFGPSLRADRGAARGGRRAARRPGGTFVPRHAGEYPAGAVSLRSTGRDGVLDRRGRRRASCSGTVDAGARSTRRTRAPSTCTAAARTRSSELDLELRRALVRPFEGDWYTQAKRETDMYIERLDDRREWLGVRLSFGTVVVTEQVVAYQTRRLSDHEVLDLVALDLPQTSFSTQALWYELPEAIVSTGAAARPAARRAARGRARADRRAPAARDVRPLGHRRAVDEPAPADRRADDLHLRRPSGRDRHHAPRASSRSTRSSTTRTG